MSRKRKIFIEADSLAFERLSGVGHVVLELVKALSKISSEENLSITLIVPFGKKKLISKYGLNNVKIRSLPPGYRYVNYLLVRTSLPIPVDLFYGRGIYIFPNFKNWYVPFSKSLTYIHDVAFRLYPDTVNQKNLHYLEANIEKWLNRTTKIITVSESSAKELIGEFSAYKQKVEVVPNGIDPDVFYPCNEKEKNEVRKKHNLPLQYFLFVGNIEPRKNLLRLLEAYKLYADSLDKPASLFLVGGGGWNNQPIIKKLQELQSAGYSIIHPDYYVEDEDLPAIYSGAKALVLVSLHEGFGLSPLQASACGTPVIASDIPVLHEVLNGLPVVYVNPNSIEDIVKALSKVEKVNERVSIKLTWHQSVIKLLKLIGTIKTV